MTIEETIKIINSAMTSYGEDTINYDEVFEAKDIAIRSLEAWKEVKKEITDWYTMKYSNLGIGQYEVLMDLIDKHLLGLENNADGNS